MSTGSGGGRITLKPLRDGRAVTSGWEWVERALRALVLLLGTNQALVLVPGVFTSLGVHRETCGFTGNALFCLPLKSPPWDGGEEEPGVLMQQHPALPALRSALSDKRARRNRHGEHSQRHANGHSLFFFFFFIKNTKAPTTSSSSGGCVSFGAEPWSCCSSALPPPPWNSSQLLMAV